MNLNKRVHTIRAAALLPLMAGLILASGATNAFAASKIDWQVIAPAGDYQASSGHKLYSVTGQPTPVGESTNGSGHRLLSGFIQAFGPASCCDKPGDANNDGSVNVGDAVYIVNYVFKGGVAPPCRAEADANADTAVNIGDAVYIINYIFKGGPHTICGPSALL